MSSNSAFASQINCIPSRRREKKERKKKETTTSNFCNARAIHRPLHADLVVVVVLPSFPLEDVVVVVPRALFELYKSAPFLSPTGVGLLIRTHLLPFTGCDRELAQNTPIP